MNPVCLRNLLFTGRLRVESNAPSSWLICLYFSYLVFDLLFVLIWIHHYVDRYLLVWELKPHYCKYSCYKLKIKIFSVLFIRWFIIFTPLLVTLLIRVTLPRFSFNYFLTTRWTSTCARYSGNSWENWCYFWGDSIKKGKATSANIGFLVLVDLSAILKWSSMFDS